MSPLAAAVLDRLSRATGSRAPDELVDLAVRTAIEDDPWFDDVNPSVAWVLVWLERLELDDALWEPRPPPDTGLRAGLRLALRAGYRFGCELLEPGAPAPVSSPHATDTAARILWALLSDVLAVRIPRSFSPPVADACAAIADGLVSECPAIARMGVPMGSLDFGIEVGLTLAAIERRSSTPVR